MGQYTEPQMIPITLPSDQFFRAAVMVNRHDGMGVEALNRPRMAGHTNKEKAERWAAEMAADIGAACEAMSKLSDQEIAFVLRHVEYKPQIA